MGKNHQEGKFRGALVEFVINPEVRRLVWKDPSTRASFYRLIFLIVALIGMTLFVVAIVFAVQGQVPVPFTSIHGTAPQRQLSNKQNWSIIAFALSLFLSLFSVVSNIQDRRVARTRGNLGTIISNVAMALLSIILLLSAGVGVYLGSLFGWINTEGNGLIVIFTGVYVVATILQVKIARDQATNQGTQETVRDETARQTSEALTLLAANLATLTALLDKQQGAARQVDAPPLSPNGRHHTPEARPVIDAKDIDAKDMHS